MNIGITNDHRGLKVKHFLTNYLNELGYNVIDYGADTEEPADFPDYAKKLGLGVLSNEVELGIAICGTGIGMSIALNKMKGIYCAKVSTKSEATLCKAHNNANVIAKGYSEKQTNNSVALTYDIYCGGAIGILASNTCLIFL